MNIKRELLTVHHDINFIPDTNSMHKFFIHIMLQSSTCFEQYYVHHQEVRLYLYSIWYRHSLWVVMVVVVSLNQCTARPSRPLIES